MTMRFVPFVISMGLWLAHAVVHAQPAPEPPAGEPAPAPEAPEPPGEEPAPAPDGREEPSTPAPEPEPPPPGAAAPQEPVQEPEEPAPESPDEPEAQPAAPSVDAPTEESAGTEDAGPAPDAAGDAPASDAESDFEIIEVEAVEPGAAATEPGSTPAETATAEARVEDGEAELETIDVSVAGTRVARTAGSAHVIDPAQLERFEYDDPHAALLQVPGVYVRQEDGVGLRPNISLRGVNPDRSKKITLMEDGILFGPAPYSAPAAYYFPLTTRMMALRVVKGPSTVAHGPQTVGGAIDYVTRSIPATTAGSMDIAAGQYGYRKAHGYFGSSTENVGFLVEGVRLHSDGFKELDGGGDTGFTRNEWMLKASYVVDPTARVLHTFHLKAGYSDEASNETYLGLTDADFRQNPDRRYAASALDRMDFHRTQAVAAYQLEVPDKDLDLTTTVYRHDFTRSWNKLNSFVGIPVAEVLADPMADTNEHYYEVLTGEAGSDAGLDTLLIGPNKRTFVSQGGQTVFSGSALTGSVGHRFEAGLRVHNDSIVRRHSQSGYLMRDGELYPGGGPEQVTTANEASTVALAVHALDTITWRGLSLTPGLRMEAIWSELHDRLAETTSRATTVVALPGLGVFYELVEGFGLLGGAYRGFSPPAPGNDTAEPEYSINYEAGARYNQGPARAEAIGFVNDYSNLTAICTFSSGCDDAAIDEQIDAGAALIYGLELYAEHTPRVGRWGFPLTAAYTFTRSEFRSSFDSTDPMFGMVEKGDELPYIPRHQAKVTAGIEHEVASLVAGFTYVDAMREGVGAPPIDRTVLTDELFVLDVGASVRLLKHLELYANLRNASDYRAIVSRRPYGARPNAPLWFQAGIKGHL